MTALSRDLQEYVVNVLQTSICVFHVQERASSMVPLHNSLQHVPPQGQPAAPTSLAFLCQLQGHLGIPSGGRSGGGRGYTGFLLWCK